MDAEARAARAPARQRSASGSVSRKLPPTIQNTIDVAVRAHDRSSPPSVQPRRRREREAPDARPTAPGRGIDRRARSRLRAPPCTPEWPRIGTRPRFGRPGRPRARPTLTSALIVSTPCACCVRPIDQTNTALGRSISSRANACMRPRVDTPLSRSSSRPSRRASARLRASSNPVVRSRTYASSTPPASMSARSTPIRNARSPPVWTCEPVVGHRRAEHRARCDRRHPVALEAGLAIRVDDGDLRAVLLRRGGDTSRSPAGCWPTFDPKKHDQIRVAASRCSCRSRRRSRASPFIAGGRRGMTEARRVVDVVGRRESARPSAPRSRPRW